MTQNTTIKKPNAYSTKSLVLMEPILKAYKEALLQAKDKADRKGLAYWFREAKALALLNGGDLTPKPKCRHCRGRGKYLLATPNSGGPYQSADFKPHACICVVGKVELPDSEEYYVLALKEKNRRNAKILPTAGEPIKSGNANGKPKQRIKKPKAEAIEKESDSKPTGTGAKTEAEVGTPIKKVRKRKIPNQGNIEESGNIT